MIRILGTDTDKEIKEILQEIKVDPYGINIMAPKAAWRLIHIRSLPNIAANILKQEMLSLGADVALARDAITGRAKETDCLLMGNISQIRRLNEKLDRQPFGLDKLASDLISTLDNYQKENFILDLGRYKLNLGKRAHIMGIVNLTPDSFSGDGVYRLQATSFKPQAASYKLQDYIVRHTEQMARDGADIIDVGGESSRPGAKSVPLKEELRRVTPIIKILTKKIKAPISIDTYKPEVAKQALDNGASIVNDITGLRNPKMAKIIAKYRAGVIIMHMQGNPQNMQSKPRYKFLVDEVIEYLNNAIQTAVSLGIDKEKIIIDPGIGFGKTLEHNLEILKRLSEFKVLGRPIMVGTSRKSFIGKILNVEPRERIFGTISSCILAVRNGAKILRAHDVKAVKQALDVTDAILNC